MKKTIFICGLALLTSACACDCGDVHEIEPRYAYEQEYAQPAPQQATLTYRSYVQASYSRPVQQQVVYQPVMAQQPRPMMVQQPVMQHACPCAQRRTCPCGC